MCLRFDTKTYNYEVESESHLINWLYGNEYDEENYVFLWAGTLKSVQTPTGLKRGAARVHYSS